MSMLAFQRPKKPKKTPAKKPRTCHELMTSTVPEQLQEALPWKGFVLIPSGNTVTKLPILQTYKSGQELYQSSGAGGRLLPIYAVLANRQVLQKYFKWMGRLVNPLKQADLADESEMARVQEDLFDMGDFGFWIVKGSRCYFSGGEVLQNYVRKELGGSEYRGVDTVFMTSLAGLPREQVSLSDFTGADDTNLATLMASGRHASPYEVAYMIQEPEDLKGVDPHTLHSYLEANVVTPAYDKLEGVPQANFAAAVIMALGYAIKGGVKVDVDAYPEVIRNALNGIAPRQQESTFSQLLGLTQANGSYRYGGMRKVGGRWVIDPSVTGRTDNSRFIVVSMPNWRVGTDGFPVMNYTCRSRPDRSTTGLNHNGFIRVSNKGGFLKRLASKWLPQFGRLEPDVQVFCTCLAGESLVLMADGTYRPIRDVRVGDQVITHLGRPRRVTKASSRLVRPDENVYRMKVQGFPLEFTVTGNHPFYALRGNEYCRCGCGARLKRPRRSAWSPELLLGRQCVQGHGGRPLTEPDYSGGRFAWVEVDKLEPNEWFLSPWQQPGSLSMKSGLARLLGYYAAEGSVGQRGTVVRFTLNMDEWDTVGADILRLARDLGYRARRKQSGEHSWFNVYVSSAELRSACVELVGTGSATKRLSASLLDLDRESLTELMLGMLLGDGTVGGVKGGKRQGTVHYHSTSQDLASQFQAVLNKLGLRSSFSIASNPKTRQVFSKRERRLVTLNQRRCWQVTLSPESCSAVRPLMRAVTAGKDVMPDNQPQRRGVKFVPQEGQLRAMLKRELTDFAGEVFDLTVEEDESFVAHGIAVHNCPDFKYRFHWVLSKMGAADTPTGAGGQAINSPPKITNPSNRPSLCKHLTACDQFIDFSNADFRSLLRKVGKSPVQTTAPRRPPVIGTGTTATTRSPSSTKPEDKSKPDGPIPAEAASLPPRLA